MSSMRAHIAARCARSEHDHRSRVTNSETDTVPPSVKSSNKRGAAFASSLAIIEGHTASMCAGPVRGAAQAGERAGDGELTRAGAGEAEGAAAAAVNAAEPEQEAGAGLRVRIARRATRAK